MWYLKIKIINISFLINFYILLLLLLSYICFFTLMILNIVLFSLDKLSGIGLSWLVNNKTFLESTVLLLKFKNENFNHTI